MQLKWPLPSCFLAAFFGDMIQRYPRWTVEERNRLITLTQCLFIISAGSDSDNPPVGHQGYAEPRGITDKDRIGPVRGTRFDGNCVVGIPVTSRIIA